MTLFQTVYVAPLHGRKTSQTAIPHIYDGFWFMLLIQVSFLFVVYACMVFGWQEQGGTPFKDKLMFLLDVHGVF